MPNSLDPDVIKRLQAAILELLNRINPSKPMRAQSALAPRLEIDRSQISRILTTGKGGSLPLIRRVARELNIPETDITQGKPEPNGKRLRQARELPGYKEAAAELRRRAPREHPHFTIDDLERAGDFRGEPEPPQVTVPYLIGVADALKRASTIPPKSKTVRAAKKLSS